MVYAKASKKTELGTITKKAAVYAVIEEEADDRNNDWLKIVFDTKALRDSGEKVKAAYIQYKDVTVLTEEETEKLIETLKKDTASRAYKKNLLPLISIKYVETEAETAAPAASETAAPNVEANASEPASTEYVITSAGIITDYNGTDTIITIPNTVKLNGTAVKVSGISETAFSRNTSITSVTLPTQSTFTKVDRGAFQGCTGLRSVSIPSNVTAIDVDAFEGCTSLQSVSWPLGLTSIGHNAFKGCISLTGLSLPAGLKTIGNNAFENCSGIVKANLPDGMTSIGDAAFRNCTALTSAYLPNSITKIGNSAFENDSAITTLSLPSNLKEIDNFTFKGCSGIKTVKVTSKVYRIGQEAFANCTSLNYVDIPKSVTVIGINAFDNVASDVIFIIRGKSISYGKGALGTSGTVFGYSGNTKTFVAKYSGLKFYTVNIVLFVERSYKNLILKNPTISQTKTAIMNLAQKKTTGAAFINSLVKSSTFESLVKKGTMTKSKFVDALYAAMHDRTCTAAERNSWLKYLNVGMSYQYVINGFATSEEFINECKKEYLINPGTITLTENRDKKYETTLFVYDCYKKLLGRAPDTSGLNSYTGKIIKGTSAGQTIINMINSSEFTKKKYSNSKTIDLLLTLMNNPASKSAYTKMLDYGVSMDFVVGKMADTAKFRAICVSKYGRINAGKVSDKTITMTKSRDKNYNLTKFVARAYTECLGRKFDINGIESWCATILAKKVTPKQFALRMINSQESIDRGLNNIEYLTMLYKFVLNRTPDTNGLNSWNAKLIKKTYTRAQIADRMTNSTEFNNLLKAYGLK